MNYLLALLLGFALARLWSCYAEGPHVVIGRREDRSRSIDRWHLWPRNPYLNLYLHHWLRDDDDPDLHDHPAWNVSLPFFSYHEDEFCCRDILEHWTVYDCLPEVRRVSNSAFRPIFRPARLPHRVILPLNGVKEPGGWSLFLSGPKRRPWGFWTKFGWVEASRYSDRTTARCRYGD